MYTFILMPSFMKCDKLKISPGSPSFSHTHTAWKRVESMIYSHAPVQSFSLSLPHLLADFSSSLIGNEKRCVFILIKSCSESVIHASAHRCEMRLIEFD